MLVLVGTLRAIATLGGGTNKKTGEVIPTREVLQIEETDGRGLVQVKTITVPDTKAFLGKVGQEVKLPVRAWVTGNVPVNYMYENPVQKAA
jgi:hypothetical protein